MIIICAEFNFCEFQTALDNYSLIGWYYCSKYSLRYLAISTDRWYIIFLENRKIEKINKIAGDRFFLAKTNNWSNVTSQSVCALINGADPRQLPNYILSNTSRVAQMYTVYICMHCLKYWQDAIIAMLTRQTVNQGICILVFCKLYLVILFQIINVLIYCCNIVSNN